MRKKERDNSGRVIATFFMVIFFPSLLPVNLLYASNNTPMAPEAASFEPVDATDMVNLSTGSCSYVLPLMNVPSPEGGYPIALSYHAGIAMDQQGSWTGLGWNLNPGAINRNVNGYPDDYHSSQLTEFFYDKGETQEMYSVSLGYSCGVASVGLGVNWGSNQATGGFVHVGIGPEMGAAGASVGVTAGSEGMSVNGGFTTAGGLTIGGSISSDGQVGVNAGIDTNGHGFNLGYTSSGSFSVAFKEGQASIGFDISSTSVGLRAGVSGAGIGISTSFNNAISMGDYSTRSGGSTIPITVPTPIGIFSLSFGKHKFKYWLAKTELNFATGPVHFTDGVALANKTVAVPYKPCVFCNIVDHGVVGNSFMDIYEISNSFGGTDPSNNNLIFPATDNFNVQAQGLSAAMAVMLYENGNLFGLKGNSNDGHYDYEMKYGHDGASASSLNSVEKFNGKPRFYFENEISSYIAVSPATFNANLTNPDITNHYQSGVALDAEPRKKTGTFIEYYTNDEILGNYATLKSQGYLNPVTYLNRTILPQKGIGAFKITTADGKTYHYSLPVYNHEIITRTAGNISDRPNEQDSYFEKRQLDPYATHWLLTSVTGQDYYDMNSNGIADSGDVGYWVSFDYGKFSDAFAWKSPYGQDYIEDEDNPTIKTWVRGRKQIYYLDKIRTRTHTAIFVKSSRTDNKSTLWEYKSVNHIDNLEQSNNSFNTRFTIFPQQSLCLTKIVLVKNENDNVDKTDGNSLSNTVNIVYPQSTKNETAGYNLYNNIIDGADSYNWEENAEKVIDLNYDYSLVTGDPRLTLKTVKFRGKGGAFTLPPYRFDYNTTTTPFDIDNMDDGWGYNNSDPATWSLKTITTPQGAKININYESHKFRSVMPHKLYFQNTTKNRFNSTYPTYSSPSDVYNKKVIIDIMSSNDYAIQLNQPVTIEYRGKPCFNSQFYYTNYNNLPGHISQVLGNGKYEVTFDQPINISTDNAPCNIDNVNWNINYWGSEAFYHYIKITLAVGNAVITGGGPRVSSISIVDGTSTYTTEYKYGENEDGIGYTSYIPYAPNASKEVPYSTELPAPRVMYEYVTVKPKGSNGEYQGKTRYKFNIMKEKSPTSVTFGNLYQIATTSSSSVTNSQNKQVVTREYTINDNIATIGRLEEVSVFNAQNHLLNKVVNTYRSHNQSSESVGVSKEAFHTYKSVVYPAGNSPLDKWHLNSTKRFKYPNILESSVEYKNGFTYRVDFADFDPMTGTARERTFKSGDGRDYKTRTVPAYVKYPSMGSKVDNLANKHMLTQTAVDYTYLKDGSGTFKETGVGITTWNNLWTYREINGTVTTPPTAQNFWRKHKTYTWNGARNTDGTFANYNNSAGGDDGFVWTVGGGAQPAQWKMLSEVTLYNRYSDILEMKDGNSNYSTVKMGDNNTKVMSVGNARYTEMFYTGGEYVSGSNLDAEIKIVNIGQSSLSHTGNYSVSTSPTSELGVLMKSGEHRTGKYKLSVWVHRGNIDNARIKIGTTTYAFNGETYRAGDWILKTHYLDVPAGDYYPYLTSLSGNVLYDDFRIQPTGASMTSYVYNHHDELTHIIDNNNLATRFEYDDAGRLVRTYVEIVDDTSNNTIGGFKLSSKTKYNNRLPNY